MARFHVRDTFATEDKAVFVLAGFVIEGEVAAGMQVRVPVLAKAMMTEKISHIQYIRRPDGEVVCLCLQCRGAEEIALWEALKLKDQTIDIFKAT